MAGSVTRMTKKPKKKSRHRGVKILRLADGRFVARWRNPENRKQEQQSLTALGLTSAKTREIWCMKKHKSLQFIKQAVAAGAPTRPNVTLGEAIDEYLATLKSPRTVAAKSTALAALGAFLGRKRTMMSIDGPALAGWRMHVNRPASTHAPRTRALFLAVTTALFRWSKNFNWLPQVSFDGLRTALKREPLPTDPISLMSPSAVRALLRSAIAHDEAGNLEIAPLVLLVLLTGMRKGEAVHLAWENVDPDLSIRLASGHTKTKQGRIISMVESPTAKDLLQVLRMRGSRTRVFPHLDLRNVEAVRRLHLIPTFGAPADFTWHALRRVCGSVLVNAGIYSDGSSLFKMARRQGHSVTVAEKHYLGSLDLPRDAKTIEAALGIEDLAQKIVHRIAMPATEDNATRKAR